jgi:hypothetical protein
MYCEEREVTIGKAIEGNLMADIPICYLLYTHEISVKTHHILYILLKLGYMFQLFRVIIRPS